MTVDQAKRPTAQQLLDSEWLRMHAGEANSVDLLPTVKAAFDGKKTCEPCPGIYDLMLMCAVRRAVRGVMAIHRMQELGGHHTVGGQTDAEKEKLRNEVEQMKREAEKVCRPGRLFRRSIAN